MSLKDNIDMTTANVYGIYGHLGGGKTLTAVEVMLDFLSAGHRVVSNIRIWGCEHPENFTFIEDFEGVDFWKLPCGAPRGSPDPYRVAIVIDECAEFFDQYSSTSPVLKSFMSWLRHSSKRGQFVFAIVQKPEYLAKSLRILINKWIVCDDMKQYRLPKIRLPVPFTSHLVRRLVVDRFGNVISHGFNFGDKYEIGKHYDTAQSIATAGRSADYQPPVYSSPPRYVGLFRLFVLIYIAWLFIHM